MHIFGQVFGWSGVAILAGCTAFFTRRCLTGHPDSRPSRRDRITFAVLIVSGLVITVPLGKPFWLLSLAISVLVGDLAVFLLDSFRWLRASKVMLQQLRAELDAQTRAGDDGGPDGA